MRLLTPGARKVARPVPIHKGPVPQSRGLILRPYPVIIIRPSRWLVGDFAPSLRLLRSESTVLGAAGPLTGRSVTGVIIT